jgi:hypothetical protein
MISQTPFAPCAPRDKISRKGAKEDAKTQLCALRPCGSSLRLCVKSLSHFEDLGMITPRFTMLILILVLQAASAVRKNGLKPILLKECEVQGLQGKAKCGTLEVYEDRAARKGRKINLNIVVLPTTTAQREPDPLFYFAADSYPRFSACIRG